MCDPTGNKKLQQLAESEGKDIMDMLEGAVMGDDCPAVCTNDDCDYSTNAEPDAQSYECPVCGTKTVTSCLIVAGIM